METFALLYLTFLLGIFITCLIVIFHLMRFSLDKRLALWTTIAFSIITLLLVLTNLYFFSQIPFETLSNL